MAQSKVQKPECSDGNEVRLLKFDFERLPVVCKDKVIRNAEIIDLINLMERNPSIGSLIIKNRINAGGYVLTFSTDDSGVAMTDRIYSWKWRGLDRRQMVADVILCYKELNRYFPGVVHTINIDPDYLKYYKEFSDFTECKQLAISRQAGFTFASDREIAEFMNSIKVTETLIYNIPRVPLKIESICNLDTVKITHGEWMTGEDLLKMDSKVLHVVENSFTDTDINAFIKKWLNSDSQRLTSLTLGKHDWQEWKQEVILDGIQTRRWDPTTREKVLFTTRTPFVDNDPAWLSFSPVAIFLVDDYSNAMDIKRSDGLLASIRLRHGHFDFVVRKEPFASRRLQEKYTNEMELHQGKIAQNKDYIARKRNAPDEFVVMVKKPKLEKKTNENGDVEMVERAPTEEEIEQERLEKEEEEEQAKKEVALLEEDNEHRSKYLENLRLMINNFGAAIATDIPV